MQSSLKFLKTAGYLVTASVLSTGCLEDLRKSCDHMLCNAPPDAGAAGAGGEAGAGAGGAGGEAGAQPCSGACGGALPLCKPSTSTCVACMRDTDCRGEASACNPTDNTCVECTTDDHCTREGAPSCNPATNRCVGCLDAAQCTRAEASQCVDGACVPCGQNADCAHIPGKNVCDRGQCVECTGTDYETCGTDGATGARRVCDSRARECSDSATVASADSCQPCVSDAQCQVGQLCLMQQFGTPPQDVGYFCFWKQGAPAPNAPADCATEGRPYVRTLAGVTSIDGETADVCGLRASTCIARREFSTKNCANDAGAPDDSRCGVDAPEDAVCTAFGAGNLCTMRCRSDLDCPAGGGCNTGPLQPYCLLE